jgi:Leucine-rich repeat (LRR) protein
MKLILVRILFFLFLFAGFECHAQLLDSAALANEPEYMDIATALKNPEKVYKLNLHKKKLTKIPNEVFTFTNLQELYLSKNKLTKIPEEIGKLTKLQVLDVSANNIDTVPKEIGKLINIKKMILNQNNISWLPSDIGNLTKMIFLDMWGNNIQELPKEISKLQNTLKVLDLRVISIKDPKQEIIEKQLPNTKIFFSRACNCD